MRAINKKHAAAWESMVIALLGNTNLSHTDIILYDKDPVLLFDLQITLDVLCSTLNNTSMIPYTKVSLTHHNRVPYLPLTNW